MVMLDTMAFSSYYIDPFGFIKSVQICLVPEKERKRMLKKMCYYLHSARKIIKKTEL